MVINKPRSLTILCILLALNSKILLLHSTSHHSLIDYDHPRGYTPKYLNPDDDFLNEGDGSKLPPDGSQFSGVDEKRPQNGTSKDYLPKNATTGDHNDQSPPPKAYDDGNGSISTPPPQSHPLPPPPPPPPPPVHNDKSKCGVVGSQPRHTGSHAGSTIPALMRF